MESLQGGSLTLEHRYDLIELIFEDGPISHYLATQDPFARPVWVHVYALDRAEQDAPALIERLRAGAERLGGVRADGILRPIDFGELDALTPFVVTERVDMPSLLDLLDEQGTLTLEQLTALIARLAPGLDTLHDAGLVHGAIEPGSIFTPADDLSRAALGMPGVVLSVADLELLGAPPSPAHAPELLLDPVQEPDPTADMWALGRLMYLCLVGQDPAEDEHYQPLDALGVDPEVSQIIACAMDPVPEERWQRCDELLAALVAAGEPAEEPASAAPAPTQEQEQSAPRPVRKVRSVASELPPEEEPAAPNKLGTFALLAALALVVSNLGWLAWALSAPTDAASVARGVLPSGLQLVTAPAGAEVTLTGEQPRVLGKTPLVIPAPDDGQPAALKIAAPGHRPANVTLRAGAAGQEVLIILDTLD